MRLVRAGLLTSLVLALAACSGGPDNAAGDNQPGGGGPVVTISPGGSPKSLCDLLTPADFSSLAGLQATVPKTDKATSTEAYCVYGKDIEVDVFIENTAEEAHQTYLTVIKEGPLSAIRTGVIGGVDESVYGSLPASVGMSVRRNKLVVAIELPKSAQQEGDVKMIRLTGQLLQQAGSLGT
jgi:hypothetical protein